MRKAICMLGLLALVGGCSSSAPGGAVAAHASSSRDYERTATSSTWVYFVEPVRGQGFVNAPTDGEEMRVEQHDQRLKQLTKEGIVLLAGPTMDPPYTGMVIFKARNRAEAERIMFDDPAIKHGVFSSRLAPMELSLVGDVD